MAFTLAALKTEIADVAYNGMTDAQVADAMNNPAFSKAGAVDRAYIPMVDVLGAVDWTEFAGASLDATKRMTFQVLTNAGSLKVTPTTKAAFGAIFPAGATRTALQALAQKTGARAEVLFGDGFVVTPSHVADARRS